MKLQLTDEQVNSLIQDELNKKLAEQSAKLSKELTKLKAQLTDALTTIDALLNSEEIPTKKKLTDEEFAKLFKQDLSNVDIAKETGYNPAYISNKKRKLKEKGLLK